MATRWKRDADGHPIKWIAEGDGESVVYGGRVATDRHGRDVYRVEKMIEGKRYDHALVGLTERQARAEYARFVESPATYKPPHVRDAEAQAEAEEETRARAAAEAMARAKAVIIDEQMLEEFGEALRSGEHDSRGPRSEKHVRDTIRYVAAWGVALLNRDLRTVTKKELEAALAGWKKGGKVVARQKRIAALKALTAWLRRTERLSAHEDPSATLVSVQYVAPTEAEKAQKVYSPEMLETVYALIDDQVTRDIIRCRLYTGAHLSELTRYATGHGSLIPVGGGSEIHSVLIVKHKKGKEHRISVDAATAAALLRLRARGKPLPWTPALTALKKACAKAGVEKIQVGHLRHTFATLARRGGRIVQPPAVEGGVPLEAVSLALGHTSTKITRTFYVSEEVPAMIVPPVTLRHPDDPPLPAASRPAA